MGAIRYADISAERTSTGSWLLTAMVGGHLKHSRFIGYTKREALRLFHSDANSAKAAA